MVRGTLKKLDAKMTAAFHAVYSQHRSAKVDMRTAAYMVAVGRVAEAVKLRVRVAENHLGNPRRAAAHLLRK